MAHYAPHRPLEALEELIAAYRRKGFNEATATIYAMIEVMDRGIGKLLAELERLKLDQRTIVIFASDKDPDPLTGTRFNHDLRSAKYEVYEGGIRVPLFIRWSVQLNPGQRKQVVHLVDLFPTILDLCNRWGDQVERDRVRNSRRSDPADVDDRFAVEIVHRRFLFLLQQLRQPGLPTVYFEFAVNATPEFDGVQDRRLSFDNVSCRQDSSAAYSEFGRRSWHRCGAVVVKDLRIPGWW